jgi:hypothetical protein
MLQGGGSRLSPVISLGSPRLAELWALRLFARLMERIASASKVSRVRMAIHTCDFAIPSSMDFFREAFGSLSGQGFETVLLRDLIS